MDYNQDDVTLVVVNWNQRPCIEMLLKSYAQHHWIGNPLKLLLFDNNSQDDSEGWFTENGVPYISSYENIGHENAINKIYDQVKTKYVLLVDSDVQFKDYVFDYIDKLDNIVVSAGELIDKNFINEIKIKNRISPWFTLFNHQRLKEAGIKTFRSYECTDWTYDVGSEFYERLTKAGFMNYNIPRLSRHQDQDTNTVSMIYEKFDHIGKVSWDIFNKHQDRIDEVLKRRAYIEGKLKEYSSISIKEKFIYG